MTLYLTHNLHPSFQSKETSNNKSKIDKFNKIYLHTLTKNKSNLDLMPKVI